MLDEAIKQSFKNLAEAKGEERANAIEEVKTLYELQLAEKKLDFDAAKEESRIEEQKKERLIDTAKEVGLSVAKGIAIVAGTVFMLKFEETGSINSFGTREFLRNTPKIKM